jgi:anti-sigma factor RsiW
MSGCGHDLSAIHALVDGELDAVHAAEVEACIAACPECAAEHARLIALRDALRSPGLRATASKALHARLAGFAEPEPEPEPAPTPLRPHRARPPLGWLGGGVGIALAACLALFAVGDRMGQDRALTDELVAAHVRSLQLNHLIDVATSDQHVVKPWFDGKLDFAPPVIDLAAQGFPLVGGRLDYVDRRAVAAIVYRRGRHTINLFVWPAIQGDPTAEDRKVQGYGLRHWRSAGMSFWAVSDVNPGDLAAFETDLKAQIGG